MQDILKVLVVSYSQSGQLDQIVKNFILPIQNAEIEYIRYSPKIPFPFPWNSEAFFDAMPESVLEVPVELNKVTYKYSAYDLIIFAYQPWFLSPSIPASSLLQDCEFLSRLRNTSVITLIGSRNMWLNSQEAVKARIAEAGGNIIGNLPFVDRTQNQISAITILHWMLKGRKTKKYNIFPKPGVSDKDILSAKHYGQILNDAIQKKDLTNLQLQFLNDRHFTIPTDILFIEERAKRLFRIWTQLIVKYGKSSPILRKWLLKAFKYYLIFALFVVAPFVVSGYKIFIVPFILKRLNRRKQVYLQQTNVNDCIYNKNFCLFPERASFQQ